MRLKSPHSVYFCGFAVWYFCQLNCDRLIRRSRYVTIYSGIVIPAKAGIQRRTRVGSCLHRNDRTKRQTSWLFFLLQMMRLTKIVRWVTGPTNAVPSDSLFLWICPLAWDGQRLVFEYGMWVGHRFVQPNIGILPVEWNDDQHLAYCLLWWSEWCGNAKRLRYILL